MKEIYKPSDLEGVKPTEKIRIKKSYYKGKAEPCEDTEEGFFAGSFETKRGNKYFVLSNINEYNKEDVAWVTSEAYRCEGEKIIRFIASCGNHEHKRDLGEMLKKELNHFNGDRLI